MQLHEEKPFESSVRRPVSDDNVRSPPPDWRPWIHPGFWTDPVSANTAMQHEIQEAMAGRPSDRPPLRTYKKMDAGSVLPEITRYLGVPGTVMVQYDGMNRGRGNKQQLKSEMRAVPPRKPTITKNFECLQLSTMLWREAKLHAGARDKATEWHRPKDEDFSPFNLYYNINRDQDVRLFVDFDAPRQHPELMERVRRDPSVFWDAVRDFVRRLGVVLPGFDGEWVAVFRSVGDKLSAHLQDLQIWARDVSAFKETVQQALALEGEHSSLLSEVVDLRIYHGARAWRAPGHCKRTVPPSPGEAAPVPRFLELAPDRALSGGKAVAFFESTLTGDLSACVAWAAFCYPHTISSITRSAGFEITATHKAVSAKRPAVDLLAPMPRGKKLRAPWEHGV